MPYYMVQAAYTSEGWATLVKNPQNRAEAVRPAIEKAGGSLINWFWAFGDYDAVVIVEAPDNVTAASLAAAVAAGGATKAVKTTPLLTPEEGIEFLRRAGDSSYRPPTG
jgi:uncharacterized protein with GYD domain